MVDTTANLPLLPSPAGVTPGVVVSGAQPVGGLSTVALAAQHACAPDPEKNVGKWGRLAQAGFYDLHQQLGVDRSL